MSIRSIVHPQHWALIPLLQQHLSVDLSQPPMRPKVSCSRLLANRLGIVRHHEDAISRLAHKLHIASCTSPANAVFKAFLLQESRAFFSPFFEGQTGDWAGHRPHHAHSACQARGEAFQHALRQAMEVHGFMGWVQEPESHKPCHEQAHHYVEQGSPGEALRCKTVEHLHGSRAAESSAWTLIAPRAE